MANPSFSTPQTGAFGLTQVGFWSAPTLVDIDGDGDLDAFVGTSQGNTLFYKNTGNATAPAFATPTTNPFGLTFISGYFSAPTFVDINADGKIDAFIGDNQGNTFYFENTGSTIAPAFAAPVNHAFNLNYVGASSKPTFVDIDGDGKLDAFVGRFNGDIAFFKNVGTTTSPVFSAPVINAFGLTSGGNQIAPNFFDVDRDGKVDALVGNNDGKVLFFKNTGTTSTPAFAAPQTNPFGLTDVGAGNTPTFVDINGNGNPEAFVGNGTGSTLYYANTATPLAKPRNDFNGDYKSDILWRNDDGRVSLWQMNGKNVTIGTVFATVGTDWKISSTGDFSGDSKADILWRNNDGRVALWTMVGSNQTSGTVFATVGTDWKISASADFGGDGKSDILWRNDDGRMAIWQMNGATQGASAVVATVDVAWKIAGTGDFGGDGKSDLLWRNDDGSVALWQMNGLTPTAQNLLSIPVVDNSWKIAGTGDFNGDSKSDILWRNDDGSVNIWLMNGATVLSAGLVSAPYAVVDNSWKITGTGDFNNDGKADILWRNTNGSVATWEMNGSTVAAANFVNPYSIVSNDWKIAAPII